MDISLPRMSGIECVKRLKENMPGLQLMTLTVYENSDRIFEALAAGACGYLVKNTPPEKLLEAIQEIARGGSPMSSHIARKVVQAFQPAPHSAPLIEHLAPREQQVLELLSKGRAYKQIFVMWSGQMSIASHPLIAFGPDLSPLRLYNCQIMRHTLPHVGIWPLILAGFLFQSGAQTIFLCFQFFQAGQQALWRRIILVDQPGNFIRLFFNLSQLSLEGIDGRRFLLTAQDTCDQITPCQQSEECPFKCVITH